MMEENKQLLAEKKNIKSKLIGATNNIIDVIKLFIQDDIVDDAISKSEEAYKACSKMVDECTLDAIKMEIYKISLSTDEHIDISTYNAIVDTVDFTKKITADEIRLIKEMEILIVNQFCIEKESDLVAFAKVLNKVRKQLEHEILS